eukprot:1998338-Rhodomonas_salina.4
MARYPPHVGPAPGRAPGAESNAICRCRTLCTRNAFDFALIPAARYCDRAQLPTRYSYNMSSHSTEAALRIPLCDVRDSHTA